MEKKNLLLFIALSDSLVSESAQIILCIKKPGRTVDLFMSVPKYLDSLYSPTTPTPLAPFSSAL